MIDRAAVTHYGVLKRTQTEVLQNGRCLWAFWSDRRMSGALVREWKWEVFLAEMSGFAMVDVYIFTTSPLAIRSW